MNTLSIFASLSQFVPEFIVILVMVGALFLDATYSHRQTMMSTSPKEYIFYFALIGFISALVATLVNFQAPSQLLFTQSMVIDPFAQFMKAVLLLGAIGALMMSRIKDAIYTEFQTEFIALVAGMTAGGMVLVGSQNLLMIYLGIETLSILAYPMAAMNKENEKSNEAGLKYALYGGISAAIMLFGMSHIYGFCSSLYLHDIVKKLSEAQGQSLALLIPSLLLVLVGIGYKIALVPFHMWSPDVYEGAPTPVTGFFAIVPKVAGCAILARLTWSFFYGDLGPVIEGQALLLNNWKESSHWLKHGWFGMLHVMAAITMTVGNISALGQKSVKRMLAYSSIAHAGTIILALLSYDRLGLQALSFYILIYAVMTTSGFLILNHITSYSQDDSFQRFHGLMRIHPMMAILLMTIFLSLAGLPPLSGFIAKFQIFNILLESGHLTMAIILALNSVIALFYYMKLIRVMVFNQPADGVSIPSLTLGQQIFLGIMTFPVIYLGLFWGGAFELAKKATLFIPT